MLAHVFFIPLVSSFALISFICFVFESSGLFTFVFELAHMALVVLHPVSGIIKRSFLLSVSGRNKLGR